jgi:hypothetical protein
MFGKLLNYTFFYLLLTCAKYFVQEKWKIWEICFLNLLDCQLIISKSIKIQPQALTQLTCPNDLYAYPHGGHYLKKKCQ